MRNFKIFSIISLGLLFGCSSLDPYPISDSYSQIRDNQILDPMAPQNNAGVVNGLEGNYGKKVIEAYQSSNSTPSEGRSNKAGTIISSKSGSGSN